MLGEGGDAKIFYGLKKNVGKGGMPKYFMDLYRNTLEGGGLTSIAV